MEIDAIRVRLHQAPFDLLSAVSTATLHEFQEEWHSLREAVDKISHLSLLSDDDISLIHATATLVATVSHNLLEVHTEAANHTDSLVDEVQDILARCTISEVDHAHQLCPPPSTYRHISHSAFGTPPPYIHSAYSWILRNVHDPYPSSDVKGQIARGARRPLRVITDWFKDVRRYIGWVSMCKNQFKGSRALAVQTAKHVYLQSNYPFQPLPSPDIVSQLEAIRTRLRDMYPVAEDNDNLSDSTDDSFAPSSLSSRALFSRSPYAQSRSSSSTPSLIFSTDDEDNHSLASFSLDGAPPARLGKRKSLAEEVVSRPLKRNRSGYISVADGLVEDVVSTSTTPLDSPSYISSIPSRKRRLSDAATEWEGTTPLSSSSIQCSRPPLRIPKRRLSVSDSQPTPKRPCLPLVVGPRKQAVSTPIPIAHQTMSAVDEWFPFEPPDTSSSVELFNWDVVVENDAFLYNSLFDNILLLDGQDRSNVTPPANAYQSPTPLDLGVSSAVDPSVLNISSAFIEPHLIQLAAPISTPPDPITATTTPVFDFLDAFLSAVNAESAEPHTTQSSSSPSTELSLNDTIDLFGDSVVMP